MLAGHAHLLQMSDGSVLATTKRGRDWDLAHSSVSDTIKRARDEVTNYMDLTARGGHDPPPKRPTEHLTQQLRVLEARGPANTAPRPDNQFGDQCVVPAFTQIEKIRKVTDLCEYIAITEPREQAAAATAISFARRRQVQTREAQAVLKRLREEKQEEERAAEDARQAEEEARLRAAEAARLEEARLAAESPETKQCRLLFAEIVRRNRSQLCPCPSPLLLPLSRLTNGPPQDEDGGGTLDREEIRKLAKRLGKRLTESKLDEAMGEMDSDASGEVDFDVRQHYRQ